MIRFPSLALAAAVLTASVGAIAPASAETAIHVSYRDLDLSSATGKAVLITRLHRAADTLCFAGKVRDLGVLTGCRSDVMASVQPAIQLAVNDAARDTGSIAVRTLR